MVSGSMLANITPGRRHCVHTTSPPPTPPLALYDTTHPNAQCFKTVDCSLPAFRPRNRGRSAD